MAVSNTPPETKFAYVILAARRARQLMAGARPLVDHVKSTKAARIAEEELRAGTLEYELPERPESEEEKDARRRKG